MPSQSETKRLLRVALLLLLSIPLGCGSSTPTPTPTPTWIVTDAGVGGGRTGSAAVPLADGRVLVSGGTSYSFPYYFTALNGAVVYDPASGYGSATGSMAAPRSDHTATLLPDGKVLVAGGVTGDYLSGTERVATAEVYDPASGTWSATGSMAKPRVGHTATLLPDGKVLVVGGGDGSSVLATAEVYDPASGTWSATGSMGTPRGAHHAALLLNGQVLVVGGRNDTASMLETAEVYDPASGTWSATGSMITPRRTHTVTPLPNGQVLVAGGKEGFPISLPMLETAEVYDPASGTWSATGSMTTPRAGHTATLLPDGKVLVAGGTPKATSEVYDPVSGHWSTVSAMTEPRFFHTAVPLPDSKVLVFKGRPTYDPSPRERIPAAVYTVEVYTP